MSPDTRAASPTHPVASTFPQYSSATAASTAEGGLLASSAAVAPQQFLCYPVHRG